MLPYLHEISPSVTAIIPTLCEKQRSKQLIAAVTSLLTQGEFLARILVVVNGKEYSSELLDHVRQFEHVQITFQDDANLATALRRGRDLVETEYFCFLDDDDIYLPGALKARIQPMLDDPTVDVVVSNGYRVSDQHRELTIPDIGAAERDPIGSLLASNWLASCGGLYRTSSVDVAFFHPDSRYHEWTYLAFRLALTKRIAFVNVPTYEIYNTPGSVSKSYAHRKSEPEVLKNVLSLLAENKVRKRLLSKYVDSLHSLADFNLQKGDIRSAWSYHVRSICVPIGFFRYFAYTRKLFM